MLTDSRSDNFKCRSKEGRETGRVSESPPQHLTSCLSAAAACVTCSVSNLRSKTSLPKMCAQLVEMKGLTGCTSGSSNCAS
ncbi:hypothetical protein RRG08_062365 [Elysia crispata]|uniref:Uncharacterized protein n=1 Tax=Elysia crispata TaxID=231223 RepID=A0AAE0YG97_9GAST|nr:hypothetical protein RRG08_062365 [Elysia crispata]